MNNSLGSRAAQIDWMQLGLSWGLRLAVALALVLFGMWLARAIANGISRALQRGGADIILRDFLHHVIYAVLLVVVFIMALGTIGVQTTSLLAVLGAAGLAAGLAMKDSLSNVASGVMLIVLRPFHGGDTVKIAGIEGVIEQVRIFQTVLRTAQNHTVILPNNQITAEAIINYTAKGERRIDLPVGIGYNDKIGQARDILLAIAAANDGVLKEPAADVRVTGLGESSVGLTLRAWVKVADHGTVTSELIEAVHDQFGKAGLSIPYPQRDLHVFHHGSDPRATVLTAGKENT